MNEVAEGVATCPAAVKLAEHGLDLPIVKAVNEVVAGRITPTDALLHLMSLPAAREDTWTEWYAQLQQP